MNSHQQHKDKVVEEEEGGSNNSNSETSTPQSSVVVENNTIITVNDVLGRHRRGRPTEPEMETRVLRSVEGIDLNDHDVLQEDEEIAQLYSDMAAEEIAKAALRGNSCNHRMSVTAATRQDRELQPLMMNDSATDDHNDNQQSSSISSNISTKKKKALHHRIASVEQQLFGLTAAMARMDSQPTITSTISLTSGNDDRLAKTANVLVGHANKEVTQQKEQQTDIESQQEQHQDQPVETKGEADRNKSKGEYAKYFHEAAARSNDMKDDLEARWGLFNEFMSSRNSSAKRYVRNLVIFLMLPALGISVLFYYALGNPMADGAEYDDNNSAEDESQNHASWSWWILFLGVRQPLIFSLAVATQAFIIDFLVLRARIVTRWLGPMITLLFVQSRGWPFILFAWGVFDIVLLLGSRPFAAHWLFWQDWIGLFNASNASGNVTNSYGHHLIVAVAMIVAALVSLKRVMVSLFLGRNTFMHFGEQLAECMKNMVLIGDIATLAKHIEKTSKQEMEQEENLSVGGSSVNDEGKQKLEEFVAAEFCAHEESNVLEPDLGRPDAQTQAKDFFSKRTTVDEKNEQHIGGQASEPLPPAAEGSAQFSNSAKLELTQLLDEWEEPRTANEKAEEKITIGAVLQFRQALTLMSAKYPFSPAFGFADTREACVESAQKVYERLLLRTPDQGVLPFETLALVAREMGYHFDDDKVKELIKVFRPDRDGQLAKLDFVKSVDSTYKSIRLLYANISNSRHTDAAFESIINFVFWFILGCFVLAQFGIDPMALLVSLSTAIIAFAFICGSTAAKYFEGMLFILLQRPYGVGDRIHLSSPNSETSIDGSSGWIVEELSLHTTTVYWGATNERATLSNGAISRFRVINAARSPNAQVYVNMMFAIDTPYQSIETFRAAVEQFMKDRPREWLAFGGFRPTEVAVDRGFINYAIIAQHRNSWQNLGGILTSKADLVKFCMEISKQLGMSYSSPPLPVELSIHGGNGGQSVEVTPHNIASLAAS